MTPTRTPSRHVAALVVAVLLAGSLLPATTAGTGLAADTAPAAATPTAPASTAPASTAPASTAPASTAPASTAPASTAPASTAPASTAPASTTALAGDTPIAAEAAPEAAVTQPDYETVKANWDTRFKPAQNADIALPVGGYAASGGLEGLRLADDFQGRPGATLLWTSDDGWVERDADVPVDGLYEITVDYYPIPGKRSSVQRNLLIDGQLPFREAGRIVFERVWKDAYWPPNRDNQGNDVRPPQVEAPQWESKTLEDAVLDINKELAKRQEEFGVHVDPSMYSRSSG